MTTGLPTDPELLVSFTSPCPSGNSSVCRSSKLFCKASRVRMGTREKYASTDSSVARSGNRSV